MITAFDTKTLPSFFSSFLPLLFAATLYVMTLPDSGQAQDHTQILTDLNRSADRPKIGLALSGGAAKGIAHIGAIKVLEEAGLPVDIVTGTSMGSIIGGLYAIGYTPEMMQNIMEEQDWNELLTDATPQHVLDIQRRKESSEMLFSIPVLRRGITLPGGLVQGQSVLELLNRLTWPYHDTNDFSHLPRSFATVVMDQESREAVTLTTGSLPMVIRASMSIPAMFEPVTIDGRTFVDGGLVRNLPATDAKELGAELLVCVDVSDTPEEDDPFQPGTLVDVLLRTAFIYFEAPTLEERELCNIVITPETGDLGYFSFDQAEEWIEKGKQATRDILHEIEKLVEQLDRSSVQPVSPPAIEPKQVTGIDVRGVSDPGKRLVRKRLGLEIPGMVSPDQIREAINNVYSGGGFEQVTYQLAAQSAPDEIAEPTPARYTLIINAKEKESDMLGFGLRYDNKTSTALLLKLSLEHRLGYGSMTRLGARLGEQTRLNLDTFIPFGIDSHYGIGGGVSFTDFTVDLFAGRERPVVRGDLKSYDAHFYTSRSIGNDAFIRTGLRGEHVVAAPGAAAETLGSVAAETLKKTFYSTEIIFQADTRNHIALPARGIRTYLKAQFADKAIGSGATFRHYAADAEFFQPFTRTLTLFGRLAITRGSGPDLPPNYITFVGGLYPTPVLPGRFLPLYGKQEQALSGRSGQLALAGLRWRSSDDLFIEVSANTGAAGDNWTLNSDELHYGFGLTAGVLTIIGPVSVTFAGDRLNVRPQAGLNIGFRF